MDSPGNLYIGDQGNRLIRVITPAGMVSTLAGSGAFGSTNATGVFASFYSPDGVAVDGAGNVYVADAGNNMIRKISPGAVVTTLAGTGAVGSVNGSGLSATFDEPTGVAVDGAGNVYVADTLNDMIRMITPAGVVSTLAGSGDIGSANGAGVTASFDQPFGLTVDNSGNVFVADTLNNLIREITPAGVVSTIAGSGAQGSANGTGTAASFWNPSAIAVDNSGNLYVADTTNNKIRKITASGVVSTLAGNGAIGGTNGPALSASFYYPDGVAVNNAGTTVYVADTDGNKIRMIH
jgi:sugar lactone lactonase YvrE